MFYNRCFITGTNSVGGQLYFKNKQTHRKRNQVTSSNGLREGEPDEGSQKVQTSSYKINKY